MLEVARRTVGEDVAPDVGEELLEALLHLLEEASVLVGRLQQVELVLVDLSRKNGNRAQESIELTAICIEDAQASFYYDGLHTQHLFDPSTHFNY